MNVKKIKKGLNDKLKKIRLTKQLASNAGKELAALKRGALKPTAVLDKYASQGKCKRCGKIGILIKSAGVCLECVLKGRK